jgi:hypothetical protein
MKRALLVTAMLGLAGCPTRQAGLEDCQRIFDRLVKVELDELGYRDPALAQRRREELGRLMADDIARCVGGQMRPDALACVDRARRAEEIVHLCLE